jgi:hypothetical protein
MKRRISASLVLLMGLLMGVGDRAAYGAEANVLERIYRSLFGGQEPPVPSSAGGSRPLEKSSVCMVSPGSFKDMQLLQRRPLVVWRGEAQRVSVRMDGAEKPLWNWELAKGGSSISQWMYNGPMLEPGQVYWFELWDGRQRAVRSRFQVMDLPERQLLLRDLQVVQDKAWTEGLRGEALVRRRVEVLSERGLWLDIVHEVFRSGERSVQWEALKQGIVEEGCDRSLKR